MVVTVAPGCAAGVDGDGFRIAAVAAGDALDLYLFKCQCHLIFRSVWRYFVFHFACQVKYHTGIDSPLSAVCCAVRIAVTKGLLVAVILAESPFVAP